MYTGTAVTVKYWISTDSLEFKDLEGIDDFRKALADDYVSVVKGRPAGAGGLTHLYVELISSLSLSHVAQLLLDGIAFDLIKHGTEAFVLRPFLAAYKRLQERNKERRSIDIAELQVQFQDSLLIIHEISSDSIFPNLEKILLTLAQQYDRLALKSGEYPFTIHIPVFEDTEEDRPCRFRVIGDIDETIRSKGPQDYFHFWGLEYLYDHVKRVYDVGTQLLIDSDFNTVEQHWAEWTRRWEAKRRQERARS
jgi:hypothetical protein